MASTFMIGATAETLTSLDELTTPLPDPQWEFREYRKMVRLGDGSMQGLGPQTVTWGFPMLEPAQIAELEAFASDDPIYIQTPKRDDTSAIFEVLFNIPDPRQDGSHKAGLRGWRLGYELELIVLSEVEGEE
jgi:hypothetical protein